MLVSNYLQKYLSNISFVFMLLTTLLRGGGLQAQELNFTVKVVAPRLQNTDPQTLPLLETAIREYLNNTKWTGDVFEQDERIKGTIQITVDQDPSVNNFKVQLAISASRPVYGSNYETPIFTHLDPELSFGYEPYQPLIYAQNAFNDNLSGVLAYYAFLILAIDYDSFSPSGGDPFWQTAQEIANLGNQRNRVEWTGSNKRGSIVDQILNPRMKLYRQVLYDYHRQGLDISTQDMEKSKTVLIRCLERLQEVNSALPNLLIIRIFSNTKANELVEIFRGGNAAQKPKVIELLSKLDPANGNKFRQIQN